jgi:hypothetical protein
MLRDTRVHEAGATRRAVLLAACKGAGAARRAVESMPAPPAPRVVPVPDAVCVSGGEGAALAAAAVGRVTQTFATRVSSIEDASSMP